jgi:hypothetical protein
MNYVPPAAVKERFISIKCVLIKISIEDQKTKALLLIKSENYSPRKEVT